MNSFRHERRREWNRAKAKHIVKLVKIVATEPNNGGAADELVHMLEAIFNHEDDRILNRG